MRLSHFLSGCYFFGKLTVVLIGPRRHFPLSCVRVNSQCRTDLQATQVAKDFIPQKKRPRRRVCQRVLDHFDTQYAEELGSLWAPVRSVLLQPECWQYGVMLNRFTDTNDLLTLLLQSGYRRLVSPTHTQGYHGGVCEGKLECLLPVGEKGVCVSSARFQRGRLKRYFLLNAASFLPVLALRVTHGNLTLDMCSAPGGKALALLQVATPGLLHCNEVDKPRCDWLIKTLESYVPAPLMDASLRITNQDGRDFADTHAGVFDKVLVDAPCSNDRSWLYTSNELQGAALLRERQKLPQLQAQLLRSALAAVRPGGVVVYSTCTLSQAENQEVVRNVLATWPGAEPEDLRTELANQLSGHFTFAPPKGDPGLLVVPASHTHTWGPMYVARIRKQG